MRECNCMNKTNVAIIMAKWTVSQYDDKDEDEPGTRWPRDFLAIINETSAKKYSQSTLSWAARLSNKGA